MAYTVLARKWRPRNLTEMVGQEHILRMLSNALTTGRLHHAYLFTGTRGVGKTTLARIFARCLNCETGITATPCGICRTCSAIDTGNFPDLLEVDAASRTKVEDTRDLLETLQYAPAHGRFRICLIDEVHMLSGHSFNALLKTLEEPPPHVKFLLATTDPGKLPITVLSRCLQFNLSHLPVAKITGQLTHILHEEKIDAEPAALTEIARAAKGSLRDGLSLLDQAIAWCTGKITLSETREMLGTVEQAYLFRLLTALAENDGARILRESQQLATRAPDFDLLMADLLAVLHAISVQQQIPDASTPTEIQQLAEKITAADVQLYYQMTIISRRDLALAPTPALGFEMLLLRMLAFHPGSHAPTPAVKPAPKTIQIQCVEPIAQAARTEEISSWSSLLPRLGLSGMAQALASHCTLTHLTDNQVALALAEKHAPLLNKKLTERIEHALCDQLGRTIQLTVTLTPEQLDTPASQHVAETDRKRQQASDIIHNDIGVKKIIQTFDANIEPDSITAT